MTSPPDVALFAIAIGKVLLMTGTGLPLAAMVLMEKKPNRSTNIAREILEAADKHAGMVLHDDHAVETIIETAPEPRLVAELDVAVEFMRYCRACDQETPFVADRECMAGLIGRCSRCSTEALTPFTRTTSAAA